MLRMLDVLASGVHDSKNQLFLAEALVAAAEARAQIDLSEVRYAIEAASSRLSRMLTTYNLLRHGGTLAIVPAIVSDLCDELGLAQQRHLAEKGITLDIDCPVHDAWPLDRDLVGDVLNNAVQNAARFAKSRIRLSARLSDDGLCLCVEDDGPGFASLPPATGTGLLLAQRLAELHQRRQRSGHLRLANGGTLGGGVFEFHLP